MSGLYYVDTSAALKLIVAEPHSTAFAAFYDDHADAAWVSSALLRVEVMRAIARALPAASADARALLVSFSFARIDDEIVERAMNEPDPTLRSLDAIHLATARSFGADLDGFITYDVRLATAATAAEMTVISPRD